MASLSYCVLMSLPRILIIGAGFAGIECAKTFRDEEVEVLLIDRQNHHLFQPLLYQVASSGLAAPEIAHPVRSIFHNQENVRVFMEEVTSIDLAERCVVTNESRISYDFLVLATGVKTGYFGHPEWAKYSHALKSLDDAITIRREVLLACEKAEISDDPEEQERLLSIVIVGGGPTGVELAGAFAELVRDVIRRDFKRIDTSKAKIYLVEGQNRLLTMYDPTLSDYARQTLEEMGVIIRLSTRVTDLHEGEVILGDGSLRAANIIWAAGVEAPAFIRTLGVDADRAGRLKVSPDLSLPAHPEVFAVGDIANCVDANEKPVPGLAPAAMQMGRHAAKVILYQIALDEGDEKNLPAERPAFRYWDRGSMATIGRSHAIAEIREKKFDGVFAWLTWLFVHLLFLIGFRNRVAVLLQWFYAYLRNRRGARIITGVRRKADG